MEDKYLVPIKTKSSGGRSIVLEKSWNSLDSQGLYRVGVWQSYTLDFQGLYRVGFALHFRRQVYFVPDKTRSSGGDFQGLCKVGSWIFLCFKVGVK